MRRGADSVLEPILVLNCFYKFKHFFIVGVSFKLRMFKAFWQLLRTVSSNMSSSHRAHCGRPQLAFIIQIVVSDFQIWMIMPCNGTIWEAGHHCHQQKLGAFLLCTTS